MAKLTPITITVKPLSVGTSSTATKKPLTANPPPSGLAVNMNGPIGLYKRDPHVRINVADTADIAEVIQLAVASSYAEAINIAEALAMTASTLNVETVTAQEIISFVFAYQRTLSDTADSPESFSFALSKAIAETSTLGESGWLVLNNYHPQDYVDPGYAGLVTTF